MARVAVVRLAAGAPISVRAVTIAGFVILGAMALALYAAGRARRVGLAPLGDLVDAVRTSTAARLALVACWLWVGWHFLTR